MVTAYLPIDGVDFCDGHSVNCHGYPFVIAVINYWINYQHNTYRSDYTVAYSGIMLNMLIYFSLVNMLLAVREYYKNKSLFNKKLNKSASADGAACAAPRR
jgi:uncharacterized membrane protein